MPKWLMKIGIKISPETKLSETPTAAIHWHLFLQQVPLPSPFKPVHYLFQNSSLISMFFILTACFLCDIMSTAFWKPDKYIYYYSSLIRNLFFFSFKWTYYLVKEGYHVSSVWSVFGKPVLRFRLPSTGAANAKWKMKLFSFGKY